MPAWNKWNQALLLMLNDNKTLLAARKGNNPYYSIKIGLF